MVDQVDISCFRTGDWVQVGDEEVVIERRGE
jgi:hypothetical protein